MIGLVPARSRSGSSEHHQCIVVGAGILGLATAWSLSRRGYQVLVLESDTPGHERSGSKGNARIFRLSYTEPFYVQMASEACRLWRELETESNRTLLHQRGLVNFGRDLASLADAMSRAGAPFERLSSADTTDRFPQLRIGGPSIVEPSSGVLVADECLRSLCDTGSFALRARSCVRYLDDGEDQVTVVLSTGQRLSAEVVVNCAGHYAISLVKGVRGTASAPPSLQQVAYLNAREPGREAPLFIEWGDDMIYGLPVIGQDILKLSHHRPGPPVSPDDVPLHDDPGLLEVLRHASDRLLPTFVPEPVATERCFYDNSRDSDFIIDRVGRIVVGCGTSGHGFKFGPLLGELMADLATGTEPKFGLERFAMKRSFLRALPNP
jgi:sarcosine oxidase